MAPLALPRRRIALAAFAIAAFALSACAVKFATPARYRSSDARSERAAAQPTTGDRRERSASDSEYPPISVDTGAAKTDDTEEARELERADAERERVLFVIDPYPPNPRCYAAGRYVPAPPMCPSL